MSLASFRFEADFALERNKEVKVIAKSIDLDLCYVRLLQLNHVTRELLVCLENATPLKTFSCSKSGLQKGNMHPISPTVIWKRDRYSARAPNLMLCEYNNVQMTSLKSVILVSGFYMLY